jgi:hypothetical protein
LVWALRGTPALAIDCYRVFFGSIAVAWFTDLLIRRPPLIERASCAAVGCAIPAPVLLSALWLGPALACCLALGIFPRLSAALLFLLASSVTALRVQDAALDNYCLVVVLFWSALLPIGRTLTLEHWFEHRGASSRMRAICESKASPRD